MSGSMSGLSRSRAVSLQSGRSSNRGRQGDMKDFTPTGKSLPRYFEPCAATAAMFLYAQGASVVCCHHDTLSIERRFSRHSDEVQLLAVDNLSDIGTGRLVVSYDAGQNAIVWDLMTGDEVARFASYEHLTAASWMRNGNVAFGNTQGNIILFEPQTSEHISTRTIDQIPVTAIAPSGDCRTFAIGYSNGQCLVATLQPRFTILHNLITSRGPSPIVTLHWHASSTRQKSDMLASQTQDGDLRVWSVAKAYSSNDPAKVVRILKKSEEYRNGPNWMAWSKNGRIIQYSESETRSWDVRTKHVTHDSIPTLEHVRGLAVFGPGATLFTLGANNTVQQFDLNTPAIMVANVQHPANLLPPSPPVSIEEQADKATTIASASESDVAFNPSDIAVSESDDDHMSPYQRIQYTQEQSDRYPENYDSSSMTSSRSGVSKESGGSRTPLRYPASLQSRGLSDKTYISAGSSMPSSSRHHHHQPQQQPQQQQTQPDAHSQSSISATSSISRRKPSRLRHEVHRGTEETKVNELFKFTRSRLSDVPYKAPVIPEGVKRTNDDLRRAMLSTIFGWNKEIGDLISDEMMRHPNGSSCRIMLAKWLGLVDQDIMTTSSESMTSSDWMLLALSGIGGQTSQRKVGRAYVQTLLEKGDVHAGATILIGMGDQNDAIEIYMAHKRYMEALILTCLFFPQVWERQSAIIKKWGEWAIQHGQKELAIRCFACAGTESTEPWASPSAAQLTFRNANPPNIAEVLSPPLSPPGLSRGPQRQIKNSALKLITSFENGPGKSKFFSQGDNAATPLAGGVTPIAESAVDKGAFSFDEDPETAFVRPSNKSAFNTPTTNRSFASAFGNIHPLPSIGETHGELLPTPPVDKPGSRGHSRRTSFDQSDNMIAGMALPRASTASPMMMKDKYRRIGPEIPLSRDEMPAIEVRQTKSRNSSRNRLDLQIQADLAQAHADNGEPSEDASSMASSSRYHWPRRRGPASVSSVATASTARSTRSTASRPLDSYIHSLDTATHKKKKQTSRNSSRDREPAMPEMRERRARSRERLVDLDRTDDRGRATHRVFPAKRSPTSPVPMSPDDLVKLSTPKMFDGYSVASMSLDGPSLRQQTKSRASSRGSRTGRDGKKPPPIDTGVRNRSHSRIRSPQSPQSMSAVPQLNDSEDEEDFARAVESQEKFRQRQSSSRASNRGGATSRDRSRSRHGRESENNSRMTFRSNRSEPAEHAGDLRLMKEDRQRKREQAARELEQRRRDLKSTYSAISSTQIDASKGAQGFLMVDTQTKTPIDLPPRSRTADPTDPPNRGMFASRNGQGGPVIGLPATPKAMRLVINHDPNKGNTPSVPSIPANFVNQRAGSGSGPDKGQKQHSPKKEEPLTLLPSTVYQPPGGPIPRCMSAPIPDEPPASRGVGGLGRHQSVRTKTLAERRANSRDDKSHVDLPPRRGSYDDHVPPPPPPPSSGVPVLKELAHLAKPPPPPPAPLPHVAHQGNSALASGMIEIVMDEDEENSGQGQYPQRVASPPVMSNVTQPITIPPQDITVPVLPPPAPPAGRGGHSRGRSLTDNSIAGRISKATERLRSGSRSRKDAAMKARSPEVAPYESIQPIPMYQSGMMSPPTALDPRNLPTGLHESELI